MNNVVKINKNYNSKNGVDTIAISTPVGGKESTSG